MSSNDPHGAAEGAVPTDDAAVTARVWEALSKVYDPELHHDIVNLGLVYGVDVNGGAGTVRLTLTSPACPYGPYLIHQIRQALEEVPGLKRHDLKLVWDPPWGPGMMSEEIRLELGFDI